MSRPSIHGPVWVWEPPRVRALASLLAFSAALGALPALSAAAPATEGRRPLLQGGVSVDVPGDGGVPGSGVPGTPWMGTITVRYDKHFDRRRQPGSHATVRGVQYCEARLTFAETGASRFEMTLVMDVTTETRAESGSGYTRNRKTTTTRSGTIEDDKRLWVSFRTRRPRDYEYVASYPRPHAQPADILVTETSYPSRGGPPKTEQHTEPDVHFDCWMPRTPVPSGYTRDQDHVAGTKVSSEPNEAYTAKTTWDLRRVGAPPARIARPDQGKEPTPGAPPGGGGGSAVAPQTPPTTGGPGTGTAGGPPPLQGGVSTTGPAPYSYSISGNDPGSVAIFVRRWFERPAPGRLYDSTETARQACLREAELGEAGRLDLPGRQDAGRIREATRRDVSVDVSRDGRMLVATMGGPRGTERLRFDLEGATDEYREQVIEQVVQASVNAGGGTTGAAPPDAQLDVSGIVLPRRDPGGTTTGHQGASTPAPAPLKGQVPIAEGAPTGAWTGQQQAARVSDTPPQRLMTLAAEMDRIATDVESNALVATDRFFQGLAETMGGTLKFLAQKPGEPMRQLADAAVTYLTNDRAANHKNLYAGVMRELEEARRDPAYAAGKHLLDLAPMPGKAAKFVQAVRAERAAQRLRVLSETASAVGYSPLCATARNDCFWHAMLNATGDRRYYGRVNPGDLPTEFEVWNRELKETFGGIKAKDPHHGPMGLLKHAFGLPVPSTQGKIIRALQKAGPGSEGVVMIGYGNGEGHVFNAANLKGRIMFWDDQARSSRELFGNARFVQFYRYK